MSKPLYLLAAISSSCLITMSNGVKKPIFNLKKGDAVKIYDTEKINFDSAIVESIEEVNSSETGLYTLGDITCGANTRFMTPTQGETDLPCLVTAYNLYNRSNKIMAVISGKLVAIPDVKSFKNTVNRKLMVIKLNIGINFKKFMIINDMLILANEEQAPSTSESL